MWRASRLWYMAKILHLSDWEENKAEGLHWYLFFKNNISYLRNDAVLNFLCMLGKPALNINGRLLHVWAHSMKSWPALAIFSKFFGFFVGLLSLYPLIFHLILFLFRFSIIIFKNFFNNVSLLILLARRRRLILKTSLSFADISNEPMH